MYFAYDEKNGIPVPFPFNRVMTPIMTTDQTDKPIDFSVHMTEWEIGAKVDEHIHEDSTEVMYCISGEGKASVDGVEYDFVPDSMIAALPGMKHQITNTGKEKLRVLCIFSPAISGEGLRSRAEKAVAEYRASH
jgi:mannose-6-phosphate isomerase-like protein (cupin superfamily)